MASNVKILRFLNEEIIAEVITDGVDSITVKNPLRVVVVPNKTDPTNPTVGFAPYCEWIEDKTLTLSKNMLVFIGQPIPVFLNQYNSQFGGIVIPETKIIT